MKKKVRVLSWEVVRLVRVVRIDIKLLTSLTTRMCIYLTSPICGQGRPNQCLTTP
jgi:hypothetical protein